MNLTEIISRTDHLIKEYGHYSQAAKPPPAAAKSSDPFEDQAYAVQAKIQEIEEMAAEVSEEKNRAKVAQKNAEIRKLKSQVSTRDLDALNKAVKKGKTTPELVQERVSMVEQLRAQLDAIPDGLNANRRKPSSATPAAPLGGKGIKPHVNLSSNGDFQSHHYQHTEESKQFEQEWDQAKARQDGQLDRIGAGVNALKHLAQNMGDEVDRQEDYVNDIEQQMDKVNQQVKSSNVKLKSAVTGMRSTRNICLDIILICVLLAIGAYIYSLLK